MNNTSVGMQGSCNTGCGCCCGKKKISWSAIIVGGLVGVGLNFLLNLFALGIGLTAFSTTSEGTATFMIGGFIGLAISAIVAMFVAGMIAGCLGRPCACTMTSSSTMGNNPSAMGMKKWSNIGELYGFVTWCVVLVFMMSFAGHSSTLVANSNSVLNPFLTNVKISSAPNAPAMSAEKTADGRVANNGVIVINPDKAAANLAITTFATFFLFFVGALAACLGGRCGISCCRKSKAGCA